MLFKLQHICVNLSISLGSFNQNKMYWIIYPLLWQCNNSHRISTHPVFLFIYSEHDAMHHQKPPPQFFCFWFDITPLADDHMKDVKVL